MVDDFAPWLAEWRLTPDGAAFITPYAKSRLLPVRTADGEAAMLKLGVSDDERRGSRVMAWWDGQGAAPVLAHDEAALLMVRAEGARSLAELAMTDDAIATQAICEAVAALHRPRAAPPALPPLTDLFRALGEAARRDARFGAADRMGHELLAAQREEAVLHGDIHHRNILDFGPLGWLAIDPWGYVGERTYDYANILKNPDLEIMLRPGRFRQQVPVIAGAAGLEAGRLVRWAFAHAGLSAAWSIEDGQDPSGALAVMEIARGELGL